MYAGYFKILEQANAQFTHIQKSESLVFPKNRIYKCYPSLLSPRALGGLLYIQKATIDINMDEIREPILCCWNGPDDSKLLSEVQGDKIDQVENLRHTPTLLRPV